MRMPFPHRLFPLLILMACLCGCGDWSAARYNRNHGVYALDQVLAGTEGLAQVIPDWKVSVDYAAGKLPSESALAGFPIGNGEVFACTGLHYPLGTLENILGPTYQKVAGGFGQLVPIVYLGEAPAMWEKQEMTWIRPGGIVRTSSIAADGLSLTTYDFALPQNRALVRIMQLSNAGQKRSLGPLSLVHALTAPNLEIVDGEARLTASDLGMACGYLDSRVSVCSKMALPLDSAKADRSTLLSVPDLDRGLRCPVGKLAAGKSTVKLFYMVFTDSKDDGSSTRQALQSGAQLLSATQQYWQARNRQLVASPDRRLSDFLTTERYLMQVQQAALGGFSPMNGYTKCWIRDSNGPVRYLLACGDFEAVKRYLVFQFKGYANEGRVSNNLLLNLVLPEQVKRIDWSNVPVPASEIASFMVLQRYWYWRHTADQDLVREQWPMLRRCLLGQQVDERGTLPFFGDETYRFPGDEVFLAGQSAPDYANMRLRSLDSAMEYVVAAQALAEMAPYVGEEAEAGAYRSAAERVRRATEELYWQADRGSYAPALSDLTTEVQQNPFAPISLHSWWLSYAGADPRQVSNLEAVVRYLAKPSGTLMTTPEFGYYVSMTPGYLLYALSAAGHPGRDQALKGVLAAAEASAGYAEMNAPDDRPSERYWGQHRFRPWEGGINAEAVLCALTGFEADVPGRRLSLSPWLPTGMASLEVPLVAGRSHFTLRLSPQRCEVDGEEGDHDPFNMTVRFLTLGPAPRVTGNWAELGGAVQTLPGPYGQTEIRVTGARIGMERALTMSFDPPLQPAREQMAPRRPFTWNPPRSEWLKPVVLLTWDPQTLAEQRSKRGPELAVLDSKISWPTSYLRSWLFTESGARRAQAIILDVAGWPGAFKRPGYWTEGEGGQLLKQFEQAGGTVERLQTGRQLTDEVSDI